jgi:Tol biopolymer transport system component
MRIKHKEMSELKTRVVLAFITVFGMIVLAGTNQGNLLRGAGTGPLPRVTAITQLTHDGYRKTNLLADGSQVYVTELPVANRVIARVSLPNSTRSMVRSPFSSLQALDLSPDHSKLLVSSKSKSSGESEFWTLTVDNGTPERVGELSGRDASWSADGKYLVFAKGAALYLADGSGKQIHQLYSAGGSVFSPRFSPDGQRIRFTVSDTELNTTSLWEVSREGLNAHALLGEWPYRLTACCGSWTADGKYYIFQANQTLPNTTVVVTSLWALSEAGLNAGPLPLTSGPMSFGSASASRDNTKIWAIGVQPTVEVVKYEPGKKKFVPVIKGLSATDVDYSKDGKWITYVNIPDATLWRSRADGSDRLQLTSGAERTALPRWSPDGKQIAFVSMKPGESWKLWLLGANGGTPKPVVEENGSQIDANWSADGSKLMFGDFNHDANGLSIRILDFKTGQVTTVPGSEGFFSPRWSPDGKHIAALSPDNTTLMLFDFDTQKWSTWLKETAGTVSYPVWSPDSQYLYFDDLVNDAEAIRRVKVGGNEAEQVFVLGSLERYPGALGLWSGRAADGKWMFVRDRSTQEVYQLSLELP